MNNFIEYYEIKGHVMGQCMSREDIDFMYINIPKNASSWTKLNLLDWNWEVYNYHLDNLYHKHSLVVLRDPIERWLSGIAEYMFLYQSDLDIAYISKYYFNLIFDRVAFDDHTEKQVLFLENLNLTNCTFFWCNSDYRKNFSHFLNLNGMPNKYYNYNFQHVTKDEPIRSKFKNIFQQALESNSKYKQQLQSYFAKDYKLIESVQFYAR